jgi:hypothetical protein
LRRLSLHCLVNPSPIERVLASGLGRAMRACVLSFVHARHSRIVSFVHESVNIVTTILRSLSGVVQRVIETTSGERDSEKPERKTK